MSLTIKPFKNLIVKWDFMTFFRDLTFNDKLNFKLKIKLKFMILFNIIFELLLNTNII